MWGVGSCAVGVDRWRWSLTIGFEDSQTSARHGRVGKAGRALRSGVRHHGRVHRTSVQAAPLPIKHGLGLVGDHEPGKPRGEVPVGQAPFRVAPLRTTRAPFSARGSPVIAPRSWRTPSTVSALCISHTSRSLLLVPNHLCPFALQTAFPSSLAGRCSCVYYGHCVVIGLASRRRSHVRHCHTCRA